ncbi:MAG: phenylacetate--CoA ligase [candidate division NC10 bacterium RIFCSPLOWO2_02_FULL_66_22]|nr:MAG: phenylacetate--CoA ligase [candidate division NC10 bacterium RIFCSPLOWO2_02_FULL_66_22]
MWNPEMETMPRERLRALQLERLQQTARRVCERVPFYREAFDKHGVKPADIRTLEDLRKLPFTRKADFRETYPTGLFAVPMNQVLRIHASSGTTGKPIIAGYTRADLSMWAETCARCLASAGAQPGDTFQNAYGYGLFTGGLGFHAGGELLGLTVIPVSGGNTERQILLIQDLKPKILTCTPSYALTIAETIRTMGIDAASLGLKAAVLGAEPWTEEMRKEIEAKLCLKAVNIYGLTEVIGPGVSCECVEVQNGAHVYEDHFYPEVIDPNTGEVLPHGTRGELVFTSLTKEALPVIRYRTGDLASLDASPCGCGRTSVRMSRIVGRTDDMLIIRGVNVFPSQIETALMRIPELSPHYQLVVTREKTLDELEVRVEVSPEFFRQIGGEILVDETHQADHAVHELRRRIAERLRGALNLNTTVTLLSPGGAPRSEGGKLKRVVDKRKL